MRLDFPSFSRLHSKVAEHLSNGNLCAGETLQINLKSSPDLYAIGRLLALVEYLRSRHDVVVEFSARKKVIARLIKIGFLDYCASQEILVVQDEPQLELPIHVELGSPIVRHNDDDLDAFGGYLRTLIPLQALPIEPNVDEQKIASIVAGILEKFGNEITDCLAVSGLTHTDFGFDLSRILLGMIDELVSNAISHSQTKSFLFAMAMSREAATDIRVSSPGSDYAAGTDKIEFLAMDTGRGIFQSVSDTLGEPPYLAHQDGYFSLAPWESKFTVVKTKETALLDNLCHGDLVIRKGRKSEGLRDLLQSCSWFGGSLNLRTGRSELLVTAVGGPASVRPRRDRPERASDFLPGVIIFGSFPVHQVHMAFLRKESRKVAAIPIAQGWEIKRYASLPTGLFSGLAVIKPRRKSETDAEAILATLEETTTRTIWNFDLKLSENIDVDYLDSLIQELGKRIEDESGDMRQSAFARIIFTNVPRNIVRVLQSRNCSSFLMLKDAFCILLDEADQVHFLGLPRASGAFFDLAEVLSLIYFSARAKAGILEVAPETLLHLTRLANRQRSFIECKSEEGEIEFSFAPISQALMNSRSLRLIELENYRWPKKENDTQEKSKAVFKLRNGKFVDCIFDFCLYWCVEDRLSDCCSLLLGHAGIPFADTLLSFMHNGDRLAFAIQRRSKIANLIVADPHRETSWENLEIEGQCVLVIDALYPGDDSQGYIPAFLSWLKEKRKRASIVKVWVIFDFREVLQIESQPPIEDSGAINSSLCDVDVLSLKIPAGLSCPQLISNPKADQSVIQKATSISSFNHDGEEVAPSDVPPISDKLTYELSPIELSTEFWQNVSALRIIEAVQSGRESRSVLFYENNERLIQNQRMRRAVIDFLADFAKNVIAQKADVILHPAHPIGAYLAQQLSCQLHQSPIVLPLRQHVYGGAIEPSADDYQYFRSLIEKRQRSSKHQQLNAVVLDDSVLTGKSIFSMLGICVRLGLHPSGILALLSRLPQEVSASLSLIPAPFSYLYRLHMPVLRDEDSPDNRLSNIAKQLIDNSTSYFGRKWAGKLIAREVQFQNPQQWLKKYPDPLSADILPTEIHAQHMEDAHLRQIICNLILHPNPQFLDFSTRVAVTYNFLEQLVGEDAFWLLLRKLSPSGVSVNPKSQSILFLQRVIYILAFTKHIDRFDEVYLKFEELCLDCVEQCMSSDLWETMSPLVGVCLLALGATGSEKMLRAAPKLLSVVAEYALDDLGATDSDLNLLSSLIKREAAEEIIGAFACGIRILVSQKRGGVIDHEASSVLVTEMSKANLCRRAGLVAIDALEAILPLMDELRHGLGVNQWTGCDGFLSKLGSRPEIIDYLCQAPGHTCTLLTLLKICKADTAILYTKSETDTKDEYIVRVYESGKSKRAEDELAMSHLQQRSLPIGIQRRMAQHLFFVTENQDDAKWLDVFVAGLSAARLTHQWCIGAEVKVGAGKGVSYYVILGYVNQGADDLFQRTAYYYWLQCEKYLQKILPAIHAVHFDSTKAWNAMAQSLRPLHIVRAKDNDYGQIGMRRRFIQEAMSTIDIGSLLRRAVRMYAEPVNRIDKIAGAFNSVVLKLGTGIAHAQVNSMRRAADGAASRIENRLEDSVFPKELPINLSSAIQEDDLEVFCALPLALVEFITYECLCNALSYYREGTNIELTVTFRRDETSGDPLIGARIENDIHEDFASPVATEKRTGISACRVAAQAAQGYFDSSSIDTNRWRAFVEIPVHEVPATLKGELREYLSNR